MDLLGFNRLRPMITKISFKIDKKVEIRNRKENSKIKVKVTAWRYIESDVFANDNNVERLRNIDK